MPRRLNRKRQDQDQEALLQPHLSKRSPFTSSHDQQEADMGPQPMSNPKLQLKRAQTAGIKWNHSSRGSASTIQRLTINGQDFAFTKEDYQELKELLIHHYGVVFEETEKQLLSDMLGESTSYDDHAAFAAAFQQRLNPQPPSTMDTDSTMATDASMNDISEQFGLRRPSRFSSMRKSILHRGASISRGAWSAVGLGSSYRQENSGDADQLGLINSQSTHDMRSDKGTTEKRAKGLGKAVAANFYTSANAARKATRVGDVKSSIAQALGDDSLNIEDLKELLMVANSLKGSLKRQAVLEGTLGTIKQGISVGISVLTGAPGAGEAVTATLEELGIKLVSTVSSSTTGQATQAVTPSQLVINRGGRKLTESEWTEIFVKYLSQDHPLQNYMKALVSAVFLSEEKATQVLAEAATHPGVAAKLMVSIQAGAKKKKQAMKAVKKAATH